LRQRFQGHAASGQLELIEGDILRTDLARLHPRPVIAGNLPYYITSPILEKTFSLGTGWERAVFLVQAEVAARITAAPGSRDFGYLSVLVQVHSTPELLFPVSRGAFRPPPHVDSAVVRLAPRHAAELSLRDVSAFLKFAQQCFRMKRKTLRAEQMSVGELAALYRKLTDA
jgi:16S rRNA (adenine1518-N6/adenine1519-N6)-dimethyltransferase